MYQSKPKNGRRTLYLKNSTAHFNLGLNGACAASAVGFIVLGHLEKCEQENLMRFDKKSITIPLYAFPKLARVLKEAALYYASPASDNMAHHESKFYFRHLFSAFLTNFFQL